MRSTAFLLIVALSVSIASSARADVTIEIDLDLNTDGIQNVIDVSTGETITGGIVLVVSGATRFSAYDFILDFEQANLLYGPNTLAGMTSDPDTGDRNVPIATNRVNHGASGIITISPIEVFDLGPLTDDDPVSRPDPDLDPVFDSYTGIAGATSGTRLGASPVLGDFNERIYDFTLTAIGIGNAALNLRGADTPFLDATDLGVVTFGSGQVNITAVPEPSTWAMCSLGLGFVALRRRRKSDAAKV